MNVFFQRELAKNFLPQLAIQVSLHAYPTPLPNDASIRLNMWVCVCMHFCEISGKALVIFGHGRRGAVTACGLRTEDLVFFLESGGRRGEERSGELGNSLLWMPCYPAASLWLTVGLNWMSKAVSLKSTSYQLSGLKSILLAHWSVCFCRSVKEKNTLGLYPAVFCSRTAETLRTVLNHKAASNLWVLYDIITQHVSKTCHCSWLKALRKCIPVAGNGVV